jgi:hypothetical protein
MDLLVETLSSRVKEPALAYLGAVHDRVFSLVSNSVNHVLQLPRNVLITLSVFIFFFWPVILSLVMALVSASAWIFWLFTSILLGCFQLLYVTYQFIMITCDIVGISMLKTYSVLRSQVLYYLDRSGSITKRGRGMRRQWRQRLESAGSYENYLKIPVLDKESSHEQTSSSKHADYALPRAQSFCVKKTESPTGSQMKRNRSFSGEAMLVSSLSAQAVDSVVAQELGEKTFNILVTTTTRLREARLAAEESGSEETARSLKYLLSGVVKRNHLALDEMIVDNARSIASSGRHGLSPESRNLIRSYYEEVEHGLEWIATSELPPDVVSDNSTENASGGGQQQHHELADRITLGRLLFHNRISHVDTYVLTHPFLIRITSSQDETEHGTYGSHVVWRRCTGHVPSRKYSSIDRVQSLQ